MKRREVKSKREKERYKHLNAEFQRIARREESLPLINTKKQRKTIEWERLEISSRKLEIPREHFIQNGHTKGKEAYGSKRSKQY